MTHEPLSLKNAFVLFSASLKIVAPLRQRPCRESDVAQERFLHWLSDLTADQWHIQKGIVILRRKRRAHKTVLQNNVLNGAEIIRMILERKINDLFYVSY